MLGLLAALYLSGLIGQLNAGYREWLSHDGLTGSAVMPPVDINPLRCVPYSLGASGRSVTLAVIIISAAIFLSAKLHDRFGKGEHDERNFTRAKEGTYGTAAWMSDREMRKVLEVTTPENARGSILGEKNGKVVCLPVDTKLNKHIGEGNLLKSLILYVDRDGSREPAAKHLPAVYQLLTRHTERQLGAMMDRLPIGHPAKAPYNLFAQAGDTVRAGIVLGLGTRLQILQNEAIRRITGHSDIDLAEPGKSKCAYFVILSDQESSTEFLSSLFFSFLFIRLIRYADGTPMRHCAIPVNIVFEEFNNIGKLDSYPRRLSVARSREIQICHVVQSLAQFQNRYPKNEWAEIIGNCDTQLMLGVTEQEGAEFFSLRSGDSTVRVNSTMTVKQTMALTQLIPRYRETDGIGRRRLLTPDEILRFPNDELLIILCGQNVLRARKFDYLGHPFAQNLVRSSIFDYAAQPTHGTSNTPPHTGPARHADFPNRDALSGEPKKKQPEPRLFAASKPPERF
jgi:type IV secretion system protein VirD4